MWRYGEGMWVEDGELGGLSGDDGEGEKKKNGKKTKPKVGEMWAVALSEEGRYVAATSYDGRIGVWDLYTEQRRKIRQYETKGSFGLCVDMVRPYLHIMVTKVWSSADEVSLFSPPMEGLLPVGMKAGMSTSSAMTRAGCYIRCPDSSSLYARWHFHQEGNF